MVLEDFTVLDVFLGLVTDAGSSASPDSSANGGSRRAGDEAADDSPRYRSSACANAGTGLFVTLGGLTDGCADGRSSGATDNGSDRTSDRGATEGAGNRAASGAYGFVTALVVERLLGVGIERMLVHVLISASHALTLLYGPSLSWARSLSRHETPV